MANFLGNLGAALQGQQNYQTWLDQQAAAKLRLKAEQDQLDQLNDQIAEAKKQRARQPDVDQTTLDYLSQIGQSIPPPPPQGQTPAPGQASVPMVQPGQRPPQAPQQAPRMMGPPSDGGVPPPPPQGPPQGPPQAQQPAPQMQAQPQQQQPQAPPIQPYRTVAGASAPQGQQGPQGIPPPPQQQGAPAPNSMSLQDAARFIKSKGITDPTTALQVLEKLTPYLNNQAKQEAATLKMQLAQQNKVIEQQQEVAKLEEKAREADQRSKDYGASVDERRRAAQEATETRRMLGVMMGNIAQQNATTRADSLKQKIATGNSLTKDDVDFMADQYWAGDKSVVSGLARTPAALAAVRSAITQKGKELGKSGADVALATAEFEGLKAGERTLGTRTANVGMAGNEAATFAKNALDASEKVNRSQYPDFNRLLLAGEKKVGNPDVVAFGSYNNSLINAYARAVSPTGAPTVSDKDHAREILETSFSKGQYKAGIDAILKEIEGAKASPLQTKQELRGLAKPNTTNSIPDGWSVKVK